MEAGRERTLHPTRRAVFSADIAVPEHEREVRFYSRVLSTPVWMIYPPVGDLAESLRRVPEERGRVVKDVRGEDEKHVYAAIQDPVGAYVALMPG